MDTIRIINYFCSLDSDTNELVLTYGVRDKDDLIVEYRIGLELLGIKFDK